MEIPVLKVESRQTRGKSDARKMRQKGLIPAVCYGKGKEPLPLSIDPVQLTEILRGARGLNSLIRLEGAEDRTVFVQELQRHPVERDLLHVDFLSIDTDKVIERNVPIVLTGRPAGVKLGGLLQVIRRHLLVQALPADLPDSVTTDVSDLEIGDSIHVEALEMPNGVKALFESNFTICAVVAPAAEEEPEPEEGLEGEEGVEGEEGEEGAEKPEGEEGAAEDKAPDKKGKGEAKK